MIEQFTSGTNKLRHLLTLDGLPDKLYLELFERAQSFLDPDSGRARSSDVLRGKLVVNAFFEPSTRTRLSFEIAAGLLGARVVNFDVANSATSKGESVSDTLRVIECLGADQVVIRHGGNLLADLAELESTKVSYINGGDGCHAHPSQALLDVWTVMRERGSLEGLQAAIIGDIRHSRVARSLAVAFTALGAKVCVAGPPNLLPPAAEMALLCMEAAEDVDTAVSGADVVVCLRIQLERITDSNQPQEESYISQYRFDERRLGLAAKDALILHPGPMNREIEITSTVADGPQSCVFKQATNGVAMRMAIMQMLLEH